MGKFISTEQLKSIHIEGLNSGVLKPLEKEFHFECVIHAKTVSAPSFSKPLPDFDSSCTLLILSNRKPKQIASWLSWAIYQSRKGKKIIVLLPIRADQNWFYKHVLGVASELRFMKISGSKNRLKYGLLTYQKETSSTLITRANYIEEKCRKSSGSQFERHNQSQRRNHRNGANATVIRKG